MFHQTTSWKNLQQQQHSQSIREQELGGLWILMADTNDGD